MLKAIPKRWLSWDFSIMDGTRQVGEMDMSLWGREGALSIEGTPYRVFREGLMSGGFVLEGAGVTVARAEKPSWLRRSFVIEHEGKQWTLQARAAVGRAFALLEGQYEVGSITPDGFLTRQATARLPEELPLPVRIFILWLVMIIWRRETDSGGSGE